MNCDVCILLLRAMRHGGGGGGESEDEVTEMTSSGSGSQFRCAGVEGKIWRVRGGRGVFWTHDVEVEVMRNAGRCPRVGPGSVMCVFAYM